MSEPVQTFAPGGPEPEGSGQEEAREWLMLTMEAQRSKMQTIAGKLQRIEEGRLFFIEKTGFLLALVHGLTVIDEDPDAVLRRMLLSGVLAAPRGTRCELDARMQWIFGVLEDASPANCLLPEFWERVKRISGQIGDVWALAGSVREATQLFHETIFAVVFAGGKELAERERAQAERSLAS